MIENRYKNKLDQEADEFIEFVVQGVKRMEFLINDLLMYSQLNTKEQPYVWVDCGEVIENVLLASSENIKVNKAAIKIGKMPKIYSDIGATRLRLSFPPPGRDFALPEGKRRRESSTLCKKKSGRVLE